MRTFTLDELEQQAAQFADCNDASANPLSEGALKYRMYLSMFLIWLRSVDNDNNVLQFTPETTNGTESDNRDAE